MATAASAGTTATASARPAGIWIPVITPFQADLSPDATRLVRHCKWLLSQGAAGLAPFGTTSEGNSLTVEEKETLVDRLIEGGIPARQLMPGTGCCALGDTVRLTRFAVKRGCAGVLTLPPFYYKAVSEDGLFRSFAEVVERVGDDRLRVYLYHIPPVAVVSFTLKLVERLVGRYPRAIAGMKDSSGDWKNTQSYLEAFASSGFDIFVGNERFLLSNMRKGGVGCITATGNVTPAAVARVHREWQSPEAEQLQQGLDDMRAVMEKNGPVIPALKQIVAHYADDPAWRTVRPPLVELAPAATEALLWTLQERGFQMPGLAQAR